MIARVVAADTKAELTKQLTQPYHIVDIGFSAATSYLSGGTSTTYNSQVYAEAGVRVGGFMWDARGRQSGKIHLLDDSGSAISLVLNDDVSDIPVNIYTVYISKTTGLPTTPVLYVSGVMDDVEIGPDEVTISVVTSKASNEYIPTDYCNTESGFNYLPEEGQVINWGGEKFVLTRG